MNAILKQSSASESNNFKVKYETYTLEAVSNSSANTGSDQVWVEDFNTWYPTAFIITDLTTDQPNMEASNMNQYKNTSIGFYYDELNSRVTISYLYQPRVSTSDGGIYPSTSTITIRVMFINMDSVDGGPRDESGIVKYLRKEDYLAYM